jgi:hypothetical protein
MAMRSKTDGRRVYPRGGSLVTLYGGLYFGPKANTESKVNQDKEVSIEVLPKSGGKAKIRVTQKVGNHPAVHEEWIQKEVIFQPRASA